MTRREWEWSRDDEGLSLRAKRGNPCRHEVMDCHVAALLAMTKPPCLAMTQRCDLAMPRREWEWSRDDEGLSLRAKRGNPCRHEVMDCHVAALLAMTKPPCLAMTQRCDLAMPRREWEWSRDDEGLSLRAKRGNPCRHEVMDCHVAALLAMTKPPCLAMTQRCGLAMTPGDGESV